MAFAIILILGIVAFVIYGNTQKNETTLNVVQNYTPIIKIDINSYELELLELINSHRKSLGLNELLVEKLACEIASVPTLNKQKSHNGFTARAEMTKAVNCGEICAYGYNNVESTFNNYLKSQKHKAIIENPIYTHLGISYIDSYNFTIFTKY